MSQAVDEFYERRRQRAESSSIWRSAIARREPAEIAPPFNLSDDAEGGMQDGINAVYTRMLRRNTVMPLCESPIEADFAVAFLDVVRDIKTPIVFAPRADAAKFWETDVLLVPQWPMGRFRYDFMVRFSHGHAALIECDGKEFHSTAEQKANDHWKDEEARQEGITLLRYAGAALFRAPQDCAAHAAKAIGLQWRI